MRTFKTTFVAAALFGAPCQIAGAVHREVVARQGPAFDMLATAGDAQRLGGVGVKRKLFLGHALAVKQFDRLADGVRSALDLDSLYAAMGLNGRSRT